MRLIQFCARDDRTVRTGVLLNAKDAEKESPVVRVSSKYPYVHVPHFRCTNALCNCNLIDMCRSCFRIRCVLYPNQCFLTPELARRERAPASGCRLDCGSRSKKCGRFYFPGRPRIVRSVSHYSKWGLPCKGSENSCSSFPYGKNTVRRNELRRSLHGTELSYSQGAHHIQQNAVDDHESWRSHRAVPYRQGARFRS